LTDADERIVANHIIACVSCREFLENLRNHQLQLKSLRRDTIHPSAFMQMRKEVLSKIGEPDRPGWAAFERMMLLSFRRHAMVFTGIAFAVVVSATLLAQMKLVSHEETANSLSRP